MSLRIVSPSRRGQQRRGSAGEPYGGNQDAEADFYMSRLIKLIPAEAVAIYPLLLGRAKEVVADGERRVAGQQAPAETDASGSVEALTVAPGATAEGPVPPAIAETATNIANTVPDFGSSSWLVPAMAWMMLLVVILLRWQATRDANGTPQWGAVVIAAISFLLWVPTLDSGTFGIIEFMYTMQWINWTPEVAKFVPEILLIFWTLLIPAFYKPEG